MPIPAVQFDLGELETDDGVVALLENQKQVLGRDGHTTKKQGLQMTQVGEAEMIEIEDISADNGKRFEILGPLDELKYSSCMLRVRIRRFDKGKGGGKVSLGIWACIIREEDA